MFRQVQQLPFFALCCCAAWALPPALPAQAKDLLSFDFESGRAEQLKGLQVKSANAEIVPAEPEHRGRCLYLSTTQPSTSCSFSLVGPIVVQRDMLLAFQCRAEVESGYEGAYVGVGFFAGGKQVAWTSTPFTAQWHAALVSIASLRVPKDFALKPGAEFSKIEIYARVKEKTETKGKTKAQIRFWVDDLRLYTGQAPSRVAESVRDSYSNPPMFNWPRPAGSGPWELQLSRDVAFPPESTVRVQTPRNFYTPAEPLEPGLWHWRVGTHAAMGDAWSQIEKVNVLSEAHRYTTAPVSAEALGKLARPRLLSVARIDQPEVTPARRAELRKLAQKLYKQGVPEHPGVHVPGDPRWPTWIDWYGLVAGKITGGTGRRLQTIAQYAMLTGDPEIIGWASQLALEACKWDPEGGSAMKRGDIGAQHLLRGLGWCYDVGRDSMSAADRDAMRKIIVQRAEQFHQRLNPFRGHEANNHAWLQTLALSETGLVLAGDHSGAEDWAEFGRQVYLGRFLCCLGYQGDNNEGIGYWSYGLGFVIDYADLMRAVCGIDLWGHPWLSQTARFPMYCAPPNAWAVSFADTGMPNHGVRGPASTTHVRELAVRTRDPYALWYSGAREPVEGLAPKAPTDLPASIHYRHIGVAIFNTSLVDGREGVTVAMHSGRYWAGHQHPDQNHFVIHAYGDKLAIDGGYYDWYGSPHFKAYSMSTLAHNTLLVDGRGQAACTQGADGRMTAWFDSPRYGYMVGDASAPAIYGGALRRFDRRILFIKPELVLVHDRVIAAKGPARYDWLLHAVVPIETQAAQRTFQITGPQAALRGRFLLPAQLQMEVKTGFPVEPVDRYSTRPVPRDKYFPEWILYGTPSKPAEEAEYLAVMQIEQRGTAQAAPAQSELLEVDGGRGVRLRLGDRTHVILWREGKSDGLLRASELETDGEAAAVELNADGSVRRAMALKATMLNFKGQKLLASPQPVDWAR